MPQVQNAVIAYRVEHDGQLPSTEGPVTAVNITNQSGGFVEKAEVIDICSLVGESVDMLRSVPDGCMGSSGETNTNFYTGNCSRSTEENGHYIFFMDPREDVWWNLYTGCDCNENGVIEEDGMENVSQYSGNCTDRELWP